MNRHINISLFKIWSIHVYRMNLIYIKPSKLVLILNYSWKPRSVKPKPKTNIKTWNVCVLWTWAYHTILIFINGSKHKLNYVPSLLDELRLQVDSIQTVIHRAWLQRVLYMILMLGLWKQHVKASGSRSFEANTN